MKSNIDIDVYGLSEITSLLIAENILKIISGFDDLDLRRLHNIIVTDKIDDHFSKNESAFRDFKDNAAFAKVVVYPKDDDLELLIIIRSDFSVNLIEENDNSVNNTVYLNALHILHHELCHVHDYNKRIDISKKNFLKSYENGKNMILYPLAQRCWAEYLANYLSSSSAKKSEMPQKTIKSFITLLSDVKNEIDNQIKYFAKDNNIQSFLYFSKANVENLAKSAAYVLGYMHGMNKSIDNFNPKLKEELENSYFYAIWNYLNDIFFNLRKIYPYKWEDEDVYENLIYGLDNLYSRVGIKLSENENKELFFEVRRED